MQNVQASPEKELTANQLPFLAAGGDMGSLIRSIDWSASALGQPATWPMLLKHTLSTALRANVPMLICWGPNYIQFYNDAFRPINGQTKHPHAMGGSARDTYAEIWDTIGPLFEKVWNGETVSFTDFRVKMNRNGVEEDCFFDFSYSPLTDENGDRQGILVVCVDTTERLRALNEYHALNEELSAVNEEFVAANEEMAATNEEMAATNEELAAVNEELILSREMLLKSEKLFRSIALNIPRSLIMVIDKEHRYVTLEGDLMVKMGYDHKDYEGKHPAELSAERYAASKPLYDRVMKGEQFSVERKAETGENYMVHFVPLMNEHGGIDNGLIIALDITDIKQGEERSAKLAAIIESSDDAIISKTLDSVITSWNNSAERIFGYKAEEIIGESIYKLIPHDRQQEEPDILARMKLGERVDHFETKRMTKDGRLLDVSLTISPVKDPQGNIIGLSKIARDITEKKLDESRKNDFIGMVSHELKTPLTSLTAIIQVVSSKLKNSEDAFLSNAMQRASQQVKRMTVMINGFLNVSRLEAGKLLIEKQNFDIIKLVEEVTEETRLIVTGYEILLDECAPLTINADREKISSVISNFVSNAIKYSPRGKQIRIHCQPSDGTVTISVSDEGMGIKPEDLEQIFDRYYRVEADHTRNISGFGIGLYLCAEIINRHNGKIWAESETGKGSTFFFSLPVAP